MKNLSLRFKFLLIIITLSIFGLSSFSYLTYSTYKKDKLSFVYNSLVSETEAKLHRVVSTINTYDELLSLVISGLDVKSKSISLPVGNYLQSHQGVMGVYMHVQAAEGLSEITLFEKKTGSTKSPDWKSLALLPNGLSIAHKGNGLFYYKKLLSESKGYAIVYFKQLDLIPILNSSKSRENIILRVDGTPLISQNDVNNEIKNTIKKVTSSTTNSGMYEDEIKFNVKFVSYAKSPALDIIIINMINKEDVLLVQKVFINQTIAFLLIIVSLSLIVGTLSARWLTWHLDDLTRTVNEIENENFNVKVHINSGDELEKLGNAFNSMTKKIMSLLDDLRKYNEELEIKVQERTIELQSLNNIQKAMLNSLGQGFLMIDKNQELSPIHSKIAEEMFEVDISNSSFNEIIQIPEDQHNNFKELISLAFQGVMNIGDVTQLLPSQRSNSKNQKIFFDYAPILDEESNPQYVLLIGTDKTKEIESLEKFNKEWEFSQMILKITKNKFSLNRILRESLESIEECTQNIENDNYPFRFIQRSIHTMKGSFSYFNISEVSKLCHDLESFLENYFDSEKSTDELTITVCNKLYSIHEAIHHFIGQYDDIIQFNDSDTTRSINVKDLEMFRSTLLERQSPLIQQFEESFYKSQIAPFFQIYPNLINELCIKLGKKVQFLIEGGDSWIPDSYNLAEIFKEFIHAVRNSMDHGIELPADRIAAGKPEYGTIKFSFTYENDKFSAIISDDGRGVDWKKIAAKDPTLQTEEDVLFRIMKGGISSKDEVSDLSGRGVGVSAIFTSVESRGGTIKFDNKIGQGLKIIISIPLHQTTKLRSVA